jgi:hypothetical protein
MAMRKWSVRSRLSMRRDFSRASWSGEKKMGANQLCIGLSVNSVLSFPRNFVFQEMGYKALANWKEERS